MKRFPYVSKSELTTAGMLICAPAIGSSMTWSTEQRRHSLSVDAITSAL